MSQRAVEQVLGKMVTDESFRAAFLADPDETVRRAGLALSAQEITALHGISVDALDTFAARLDGRICRLCVSARPEPMESSR